MAIRSRVAQSPPAKPSLLPGQSNQLASHFMPGCALSMVVKKSPMPRARPSPVNAIGARASASRPA